MVTSPRPFQTDKTSNNPTYPIYTALNTTTTYSSLLKLKVPTNSGKVLAYASPKLQLLMSPDGGEVMINPVYERHMSRLSSWSLGEAYARTFPD